MKNKYWYIKERHNPRMAKPYYTALGNISVKEAKKHEKTLYGYNYAIRYTNYTDYENRCKELGIQIV